MSHFSQTEDTALYQLRKATTPFTAGLALLCGLEPNPQHLGGVPVTVIPNSHTLPAVRDSTEVHVPRRQLPGSSQHCTPAPCMSGGGPPEGGTSIGAKERGDKRQPP